MLKTNSTKRERLYHFLEKLLAEGDWGTPLNDLYGCAAGQVMVFCLSVLNRVYNLLCICPKQGIISCESVLVIIACTIDLIDN